MSLLPGTRLGPYDILAKLGEGGMGEVYRATDSHLKRSVAIKVLPASVAADPERLARFQREAEVLAALNHPNIAQIYGLEKTSDVTALVMELVEGDDLSQRIARSAIPIDDALPIAKQIAEALEAAHEQGIIHRDLKPANIKVRPDGTVKVLDFGLAKAMDPNVGRGFSRANSGAAEATPYELPTMTSPAMTGMGVILGTAAYMSPEQARGRPVDRRADIWSFGVVLFEMLTGRTLFVADTVGDTLAAVLREDIPWSALPADTPPGVTRLLRRCLTRDPRQRLHSAADARIELDEAPTGSDAAVAPAANPHTRSGLVPWIVAGLLALALAATWGRSAFVSDPAAPLTQVKLELSPHAPLGTLFGANAVLSPDGRTIAFVVESQGTTQLFVRRLDQLTATALAGTEQARSPFFSPDSKWIGFQSPSGLMKIGVGGGAVVRIGDTGPNPGRGATWSGDTIVFGEINTGLFSVPADGSRAPAPLTTLDDARDERTHRWPSFLPDGRTVLFMVQHRGRDYDDADIEAVSLDTGRRTLLVRGGAFPRYAEGRLLFVRNLVLHAAAFDTRTLRVDVPSTPILEGVLGWTGDESTGDGSAEFSLSDAGDLLYRSSGQQSAPEGTTLVWVDRNGDESPAFHESIYSRTLELSPDGRYVAIQGRGPRGLGVFIKDLERGTLAPLTVDGANETNPAWSPTGTRIAYTPTQSGAPSIRIRTLDGSEPEREISSLTGERSGATGWLPDESALIVGLFRPETINDIGRLNIDDSSLTALVASTRVDGLGRVSAGGRWLAYESEEKGLRQVFVTSLETAGPRYQVSPQGGRSARWSRDGSTLYFVETGREPASLPEALMAVAFDGSGPVPRFGTPRPVFRGLHGYSVPYYDTHPDGRILFIKRDMPETSGVDPTNVVLVTGWAGELARRR